MQDRISVITASLEVRYERRGNRRQRPLNNDEGCVLWSALTLLANCDIVPARKVAQSELYHYAATLFRPPSHPQASPASQNRHSTRVEDRSWHQCRSHRLSQTQALGLPVQLYSSRSLLYPPRSCPFRRHRLVVSRGGLVFPLRHSRFHP